jgi:hypothetical protein
MESQPADGSHELRPVEQSQSFLGLQLEESDSRPAHGFGARKPLVLINGLAAAD